MSEVLLTVCTPYKKEHEKHLNTLLKTLPDGVEWITMETTPVGNVINKAEKTRYEKEIERGITRRDIQYEINVHKFGFGLMRNDIDRYANGDWILHVDADMELLISQNDIEVLKQVNPKIGGFTVMLTQQFANKYLNTPQVRLYRNKKNFQWVFRCHEIIERDIAAKGYEIAKSPILLRHNGYNGLTVDDFVAKYHYYLELMQKSIQDGHINDEFLLMNIYRTLTKIYQNQSKGR